MGPNFYGSYNLITMLVFNSMFAFLALGMTFVIMTGGIDLSVSSVCVLATTLGCLVQPLWTAASSIPDRDHHHNAGIIQRLGDHPG